MSPHHSYEMNSGNSTSTVIVLNEVHQTQTRIQINTAVEPTSQYLSTPKSFLLIAQLCLVSVLCSVGNGLITIAIPTITTELSLNPSLVYWPVLVSTLASGSLLLLAGTVADVLGNRLLNLCGVFGLGLFALVTGFVRNGSELVAFRALSGVALSLFLPTSVSIVSCNIASGRMRNVGFSFIGVGQALGYALGLVLGGVLVDTAGWRVGYYLSGAALLTLFVSGFFILPKDRHRSHGISNFERLRTGIDWVGVAMSSGSLALLAYVLAEISSTASNVSKPYIITLLIISVLLIPMSAAWFMHRERQSKPALIPPSLFRNMTFASICMMIMLTFAELATTEFLTSLYFQKVQGLPALQASVKLLPNLIVGGILNFTTGLVVDKISAIWLVLFGAAMSAISPLLMALVHPTWPYWWMEFPAQALLPFCADILFTVALLMVSEIFPEKDQALAGAVFNTVNQFGQSLGLAIIGVITNSVTRAEGGASRTTTSSALLAGYRAGFWTNFAWMICVCFVAGFGLRNVGKVGLKRD